MFAVRSMKLLPAASVMVVTLPQRSDSNAIGAALAPLPGRVCWAIRPASVNVFRVVSNLGVFDFETPDHRMRLRSLHPGVSVADVTAATGFDLVVPDDVPTSRLPTAEELRLLTEVVDPDGTRHREVPEPG